MVIVIPLKNLAFVMHYPLKKFKGHARFAHLVDSPYITLGTKGHKSVSPLRIKMNIQIDRSY